MGNEYNYYYVDIFDQLMKQVPIVFYKYTNVILIKVDATL